jgi:hypothetical protein
MTLTPIAPRTSQPSEPSVPALRLVADQTPLPPSPVATSLTRRLRLALLDLGLASVLPEGWAHPEHDGIGFEALSIRAADRLVCRLEDLARTIEEAADFGTTEIGGEPDDDLGVEQLHLFDPTPYTVEPAGLGPMGGWVQPW